MRFAAFLLSLSQAEARIVSATAEVRCEGMGLDYGKEREREYKKIIHNNVDKQSIGNYLIYFNKK